MASSKTSLDACPSASELDAYRAGELPPERQTALEEHLATCPACAARDASQLAEHESWIGRLRAAGPPPASDLGRVDANLDREEIPGYEILEEIGRGGQGIVFRALQKSTKRQVAIKVVREGRYASPAARRRFEREVELVAALNHPHIVTVFDSGQTRDGRQYVVMDCIRGRRLDHYVAAEAPSLPARLALFSRICHAVNYAHQRSVIHRDLKPSNVLISEDGQPHILDFGLARHVVEAGATALTLTGQVAGTLPYMSPEQARGLPDAADVRADVYALGVMLYELLTGTYPYPVTGDPLEVLRHIAETPPSRLRRRTRLGPGAAEPAAPPAARPGIDEELETIVLKALAKERERRYQTAGDLGRDIDHYLAHEPIEAKRDSNLYMLRMTLRRYRVAAGVTAGFALLICAAAVALGIMYRQQVQLRAQAERHAELAAAAQRAAQARFEQVRGLARFFVLDFDPLIARLPGAAPARRVLVEKGLEYLDALAREAQDDRSLQLDLAGAYLAIGDVQGNLDAASLANVRAALASYRKAEGILAGLVAVDRPELRARRTQILCLLKIGDALTTEADSAGGRAAYEQALALGTALLAENPADESVGGDVANAHQRLGNVLLASGQTEAALEHFQQYLDRVRLELAAKPDDLWTQRALGVALTKLAGVHYRRHELGPALEQYQEFRSISERLCAAYPDDIVARRDLGIAHQWVGIILADRGEGPAALESFAASNRVFEELLRADPQDAAGAQIQLVTNHSKMGEIHLAAGRRDDARGSFEHTVALIEPLAERWPDRPDVLRLQGVAYYKLAELERAGGHWPAAIHWLEKSRAVFVAMRQRQLLGPADAAVPEELATEIAACEAAAVVP